MASERTHAAVVFAAGGSRRLGRPKQLLRREGETLLHRAVRLAQETGPSRVLVVLGAYREEAIAALRDLDCETRDNPDWEQGLSSSLHCAAQALSDVDAPILLLVCDQPALERSHLRALLSAARHSTSACAATAHGASLGIPAVVMPALLRQHPPERGDQGLRRALNALPRDALGVLDAAELGFDIDTPADLKHARRCGWIDPD